MRRSEGGKRAWGWEGVGEWGGGRRDPARRRSLPFLFLSPLYLGLARLEGSGDRSPTKRRTTPSRSKAASSLESTFCVCVCVGGGGVRKGGEREIEREVRGEARGGSGRSRAELEEKRAI